MVFSGFHMRPTASKMAPGSSLGSARPNTRTPFLINGVDGDLNQLLRYRNTA